MSLIKYIYTVIKLAALSGTCKTKMINQLVIPQRNNHQNLT